MYPVTLSLIPIWALFPTDAQYPLLLSEPPFPVYSREDPSGRWFRAGAAPCRITKCPDTPTRPGADLERGSPSQGRLGLWKKGGQGRVRKRNWLKAKGSNWAPWEAGGSSWPRRVALRAHGPLQGAGERPWGLSTPGSRPEPETGLWLTQWVAAHLASPGPLPSLCTNGSMQ